MRTWIAVGSILRKDVYAYYLKPPNISWGLIFPLAWTLMFFARTGAERVDLVALVPGLMILSILFGSTSMLSVTITFERRSRSFERLLLAPITLTQLMLAKTAGAILFGAANACVPLVLALAFTELSVARWGVLAAAVLLTATASTLLGLAVAVSVSEVFEAQTFSNFFRFPMIFLSGLFFPVASLPAALQPLSFLLPPTYGVEMLRTALEGTARLGAGLSAAVLLAMIVLMFGWSVHNVQRRWVV